MQSMIIGTAGHIDHGKTSLIKALNGFEGDEMKSEIEKGITIDLSFSNLKKGDENIAFVDVPGHENLVKTMISGAYAFDAAMLVVASNDSLMPQTKEHIQILSLLNVKSLILCITKCDLTSKNEQISVQNETLKYIENFKNLEVLKTFFVSTKDELSIAELKNFLFTLKPKKREESALTRYYIDRVFSFKGVGTIVTGSLIEGTIKENERLFCLDINKEFLVKSIQVHDEFTKFATHPNRVALNLANAKTSELKKGYILSKKGFFRGFKEIDTVFYGEISHTSEVIFCVGSRQIAAKALVLSTKEDQSFVTFKFEKELFLKFNEAFVVLENSRVIGGGRVLNPISEPLKKAQKIEFLMRLLEKNFKKVFEILTTTHKHGFGLISSFQRFDLTHEEALEVASSLNQVFVDKQGLCIYGFEALNDLKKIIKFIIEKNKFAVISAQSIAIKITWATNEFANFALDELVKEKILEKNNLLYVKKGVELNSIEENLTDKIFNILESSKLTPKAPYNIYDDLDIDKIIGDNIFKSLTKSKKIVRLAHNLFVTSSNLNIAMKEIREIIKKNGLANVQILKEKLALSRKFAIAYLEYLDKFDDIKNVDNDRMFINFN
ncbi:selenocysteine-specific translation elongation factor [Campylobacter ureolyticus]|uniref:selenocysteine-specific translation elongation factor n=1 Tax=Campylobacter ureolyticus TaxID=827 RepID=UPI0022B42673|nr:selenocysteine-specific translation elongation factor [Campylobacter ureolyticus]MCZ6133239.1 selenocysteine-specific translation elongation factor [Campylobacter ureolyticus]